MSITVFLKSRKSVNVHVLTTEQKHFMPSHVTNNTIYAYFELKLNKTIPVHSSQVRIKHEEILLSQKSKQYCLVIYRLFI